MLKLKTKWFYKWARKNNISDKNLSDTLNNLSNNLGSVNLGSGLYKVRTAKTGKGKSSSFRTLVVYKKAQLAVFVYGFSKSERSNIDKEELNYFKKLSHDLLLNNKEELEKSGVFIRIEDV